MAHTPAPRAHHTFRHIAPARRRLCVIFSVPWRDDRRPLRDLLEEATTTIAAGGDVRRAVGLVSLLSVVTTSVAAVTAAVIALVVFLFVLSPFAFLLGFGLLLG